ncbi:hypothetical protein ACA910_006927 [Epithemia clementina (nom. ined.)]
MEKPIYQHIYKCHYQAMIDKSNVLYKKASAINNQIETFPSTTNTISTSSIPTSDGEDIRMVDNLPMKQKKNGHPGAISETSSFGILLGPEPITRLSLTTAIAVTQGKIFNKEWTSKPGAAYLQVKGDGIDTIQTSTKRATNIALLTSTDIDNDDEVVGEIFEHFHEDPTMFAINKGPVTGESDADFNDNVDVVMHLLFLGIVKSAIEQTTKWLRK